MDLLADSEDEDAENHDRNKNIKKNTEFNDQRHSVSQRNRSQEEAILKGKQPEDLSQGLATIQHGEKTDQEQRDRDSQRVMPECCSDGGLLWMGKGLRHNVAHQSQAACDENGQRSVAQRFDVPPHFDSAYAPLAHARYRSSVAAETPADR